MFTKKRLIISTIAIVTFGNAAVLGYALTSGSPAGGVGKAIGDIIKKKSDVKNSELKVVSQTQKGKLLGSGQYNYESMASSKITQGDSAQLIIAANENSGGHFVLALLGQDTKIPSEKINPGWAVNTIAQDRMWAPGACSSKPTFLLQGKYIFIDDGKTNPDDKYSSYIVFNMASGKYNYFGGSNFSKAQGDNEIILKAVNENDKLVFYIDPVDSRGPLAGNTEGKHSVGSDHGYIIRREIDPATMAYTDYSLPFTDPAEALAYTIKLSYLNALINIAPDGSLTSYDGQVIDNHIELKNSNYDYSSSTVAPPLESGLELKLNGSLAAALPSLAQQTPASGAAAYTTKFSLSELGSNAKVKFLIASQRSGGYDTPVIYNEATGAISPLTDDKLLQSYSNYVPLGVF